MSARSCTTADGLSPRSLTRRRFLSGSALGLGSVALASLLAEDASGAGAAASPFDVRAPHFAPRAKRVIFLYMLGGPSQLDLFEPKAELARRDGEPIPESFLKGTKFAQIQEKQPKLMGSPWKFARYGAVRR